MAEYGNVQRYGMIGRDGRPYGMMTREGQRSGERDVYFTLDSYRIPKVNPRTGNFGWAFPKNGEQPEIPKSGDSVVLVKITNPDGSYRATRWTYEALHEAALVVISDLLAVRDYRDSD